MGRPRLAVAAIILSQFGPPFMFSGVAIAVPSIGSDLEAGAISLGLLETLFLGGSLAALLPAGFLADSSDRRTLYRWSLIAFAGVSMLISTLSSIELICGLRFLQGATAAVFASTGPAILAELVPKERRGRVFGASIGSIYAGLTLGPVIAGTLIERWSWRAVFFVGGLVIFLGALAVFRILPSPWRRPQKVLPFKSVFMLLASTLCLVFGSSWIHQSHLGYVLIAAGFLLGMIFLRQQSSHPSPLLNLDMIAQRPAMRQALTTQWLLYTNAFSAIFLLSMYMQVILQAPPTRAGQVLASGSILMAITAPLSGRWADRTTARMPTTLGVGAVTLSMAIAIFLHPQSSLILVALVVAIHGIGFAFFASPNMTVIMNQAPPQQASAASSLAAGSRSLGMVTGMLITSILISIHVGFEPLKEDPTAVLRMMTQAFAILTGLGGLTLVLVLRHREELATP